MDQSWNPTVVPQAEQAQKQWSNFSQEELRMIESQCELVADADRLACIEKAKKDLRKSKIYGGVQTGLGVLGDIFGGFGQQPQWQQDPRFRGRRDPRFRRGPSAGAVIGWVLLGAVVIGGAYYITKGRKAKG